MGRNKDEYFKHLNESLSYKFSLGDYNHYENMINCRNKYVELHKKYIENQHDFEIEPNSKENVFGYIFQISTHFFNELLNDIILSSYDSAHFSIRRIAENYVIFTFLIENEDSISDFFKQVSMNRYNHLINSETLRKQVSKEVINKAEEEYRGIMEDITIFFNE